jgi:hypothetical protein
MTFQITTPTGGSDSLNFKNFGGTSIGSITATDGSGLQIQTGTNSNTAVTIANNQYVGIGTTSPSWALTLGSGQISINPSALGDKLYTYNNTNYRYGIAISAGEHRLFAAGDGVTTIGNVSNDGNFTYTAKLTVQNAGYISMPYQPKFHATGNGTGSTTGGYFNFPSVYTNISSSYNSSTGKFTAPVAGTYYIYASVMASSGTGRFIWQFYKNGSSLNMNQGGGDSTNYDTWFGAITVTLASGDYVQVYNTSGSPYNNSQEQNFGGWLLG